ncbi:gap-pol polyprotein [Lasius niger]|uniref:RNA-directed DNA polymerase n=1 Tax=Lasius niger TaxID=67767 RepID=A0A0J7N212_LASNI|nr:gap-pol polyprotein [Lasius niger]
MDRVVGYASRTLTQTERNYAQIEKEMLAIVFGCTRFDQVIAEVQFVKGKENVVADALSWAAIKNDSTNQKEISNRSIFEVDKDTKICQMIKEVKIHKNLRITPQRIDQIKEATRRDNTMQRLVSYITSGWPRNDQILTPFELRKNMINRAHVAHTGTEATINLARETIFWPGMSDQIKQKV